MISQLTQVVMFRHWHHYQHPFKQSPVNAPESAVYMPTEQNEVISLPYISSTASNCSKKQESVGVLTVKKSLPIIAVMNDPLPD